MEQGSMQGLDVVRRSTAQCVFLYSVDQMPKDDAIHVTQATHLQLIMALQNEVKGLHKRMSVQKQEIAKLRTSQKDTLDKIGRIEVASWMAQRREDETDQIKRAWASAC